ncbi:hypothetical protein [Rhodanobacter sp. MP1X3]|uniref:hypothetical protein n=1 Tax=Rhodanobacter sp. MP1X3 TaxID=2723086 RepID=UPI001620976C|nr:hypothetical protein [Rhodanobacter sp. MP1X3]MBB6243736.1 hypothetical protein [Rhodanobacter sp. MP1X3]
MTTAHIESASPLAGKAESACSRFLGGPAQLSVHWVWEDGETVTVHLHSMITMPATHIHTCKLSMATAPVCKFRMPAHVIGPQERHVEMHLEYDADDRIRIHADIPVAINKWFRDFLVPRPDPREPERPADPDGPDQPDSPSWSPFHDPEQAHGFNIANPRNRYQIFNFLWLRDIRPATADNPRFIRVEHVLAIAACPLLSALRQDQKKATDAAAAWTAIRATATTYVGAGAKTKSDVAYPYIKSLADLDKEWQSFIDLQRRLLQVHGEVSLDTLDAIVAETIADRSRFAEDKIFRTQWIRVWQSLIALILTTGKVNFADALSNVLRVAVFVFDLSIRDTSLMQEQGRRDRLGGVIVIPTCAVPPPGAIPHAKEGNVRALGVGELQAIYKECERYALGPVSRTFTVLQGERRRVQTSEESVDVEHLDDATAQATTTLADESHMHASDLEGALRATVESGCHERDFNKLNIVYSDIYMPQTISGDWVDTDTANVHDQTQVTRLAQEITRRATRRIADSVQQTRRVIHARRWQHTVARDIDNRNGTAHLNGLYRWLIRRSRLVLHDEGRRLVIECLIATPAAAFITQVDQPAGVPITPPPTLASFSIHHPSDINHGNYLELASIYGFENPPAPPEQYRQFIAQLSGQASPSHEAICLPEGFKPSAGRGSTTLSSAVTATLSYVTSDKTEVLACIVGDYKAVYGGTNSTPAPATVPAIAAEDPAAPCCKMIDPFTQKPPIPPVIPSAGTDASVTIDPSATDIPILAYSHAQSYALTVTLLAEDSMYAERTKQWQQALYDQLLSACIERRRHYDRERMERVSNDLGTSERAFFVSELKRQALDLLAAQYCSPAGTPSAAPSFVKTTLDEAFQWRQMAYAFFPWNVDQPGAEAGLHWRGLDSASHRDAELLDAFLAAGSARVLLPVTPGYELALMYYLSYGALWRPDGGVALLPEPWLDAAADIAHPCTSRRHGWWIEEPTALEVLQEGDELPHVDLQPATPSPTEGEYPRERKR